MTDPKDVRKPSKDEDDIFWPAYERPDIYIEPSSPNFLKEKASWRILAPLLLFGQAGISLLNVICSLALLHSLSKLDSKEFNYTSIFWLAVGVSNVALPVIMLACFRAENTKIMRIYTGASVILMFLLLVSIIQAIVMLLQHSSWADKISSDLTLDKMDVMHVRRAVVIAEIIVGVFIMLVNIVIDGISMYVIHEFAVAVEKNKMAKLRKQLKGKATLQEKHAERRSPWWKIF